MIQEFVNKFMSSACQDKLKFILSKKHPEDYQELVKIVLKLLENVEIDYESLNIDSLTQITTGGHSGALLYVIASQEYGSKFWYVKIDYGSCSGCDTLENIRYCGDVPLTEEQIKDYMALALHIVQGLKEIE